VSEKFLNGTSAHKRAKAISALNVFQWHGAEFDYEHNDVAISVNETTISTDIVVSDRQPYVANWNYQYCYLHKLRERYLFRQKHSHITTPFNTVFSQPGFSKTAWFFSLSLLSWIQPDWQLTSNVPVAV